ncbi:hypothetical protein pb186bvf_018871 [Paramecium bursaria]
MSELCCKNHTHQEGYIFHILLISVLIYEKNKTKENEKNE